MIGSPRNGEVFVSEVKVAYVNETANQNVEATYLFRIETWFCLELVCDAFKGIIPSSFNENKI